MFNHLPLNSSGCWLVPYDTFLIDVEDSRKARLMALLNERQGFNCRCPQKMENRSCSLNASIWAITKLSFRTPALHFEIHKEIGTNTDAQGGGFAGRLASIVGFLRGQNINMVSEICVGYLQCDATSSKRRSAAGRWGDESEGCAFQVASH